MKPETCTTSNTQRTDRDETANVALIQRCWDMAYDLVDNYSGGDSKHFLAGAISAALQHVATSAAPTLPADVKGIIARLREGVQTEPGCSHPIWSDVEKADALMAEAATALSAQAALLAEFVAATKPFVLIANIEDSIGTKAGESIMVNVDLCRAASRLHHEMAEG